MLKCKNYVFSFFFDKQIHLMKKQLEYASMPIKCQLNSTYIHIYIYMHIYIIEYIHRCWTARHFNTKCIDTSNPHKFLKIQIIESVQCDYNVEGKLWEKERYWQCQLFTNTHGMNSVSDLYSTKRKGCGKK